MMSSMLEITSFQSASTGPGFSNAPVFSVELFMVILSTALGRDSLWTRNWKGALAPQDLASDQITQPSAGGIIDPTAPTSVHHPLYVARGRSIGGELGFVRFRVVVFNLSPLVTLIAGAVVFDIGEMPCVRVVQNINHPLASVVL
jgi:hypothetical protein